ncbi:alpha/beta hydrolase [Nocardia terpenica]|uniref:Alpha/beta fold hydrolase n=1 Tax=Nocardia terpenica TaxID=455432 RepID=A0A6G9ZA90_9NOCA|nr:alpha/beta fold hydrolase [Nocardia terpenica]QIS22458.1 alpha/beta fold hydrolase [Nocardia terpenica]
MPFFEGGRGRLHYRRWPVQSPGAVVTLLPGTGQNTVHYHRFARALTAVGVETWGLDTSGQGLSEGDPDTPGTVDELAVDAQALIDLVRLEHIEPPMFVAGHSLGAATALIAMPQCAGLILTGTPRQIVPLVPLLPRTMPALVMHGMDDRRAPIDPIRDWTARQQSVVLFREYADAGHDLLHEPVRTQVTADIVEWIRNRVAYPVRHGKWARERGTGAITRSRGSA